MKHIKRINEDFSEDHRSEREKIQADADRLAELGLDDSLMDTVASYLKKFGMSVEKTGPLSVVAKAVRWMKDNWARDSRQWGKNRPNHYYFIISNRPAENTVTIIWHSMKGHGEDITIEKGTKSEEEIAIEVRSAVNHCMYKDDRDRY